MPVRLKFILLCSCLWATLSCAADTYESNPAAQALVDELVKEEGFDRASLERVFASAERQESILEAIARPAEKTKPWYEYRKIFLTKKREQKGLEFLAEHRETLARAEQTYGVPREIIVAIIGVETLYGKITGSYRVIDALSTLAFDYPKRSPFFTKELKNYLVLTRDQGFDPLALKGSYAGAMGYGQFMPSSYLSYAVDFDGDEVIDIWNNPFQPPRLAPGRAGGIRCGRVGRHLRGVICAHPQGPEASAHRRRVYRGRGGAAGGCRPRGNGHGDEI
jgi:membrane-bound lytic murein transglycosylase B